MRVFIYFIALSVFSFSKGVSAGTVITNVAKLSYNISGLGFKASSNTVINIVDQVVDFDIICQESTNLLVEGGQKAVALTFKLTNVGNGTDKFTLFHETNASSNFSVSNPLIYIDSNKNGIFDIAKDKQVKDVNLSEDAQATLFIVSDIPKKALPTGSISTNGIHAVSALVDGLSYAQSKNIGSYFVVNGVTAGMDKAFCGYEIHSMQLLLKKSSTLSSDKLFTGTTIHYKIKVSVLGTGTINNVVINDNIPKKTSYIPNSLKLNDKSLSDAKHFLKNKISVPIGDITQTNTSKPIYFVTFDARVK